MLGPQLKSFMGMCTSIPGVNDSDEELVTQFLVFMLVGLDGLWKYPVGYWFTNHNSGEIVVTLVRQSLKLTDEHEIDVRALEFDGLPANISMANDLGAKINLEDMKNFFEHPTNKKLVYIILDVFHMLKLVRNLLGDYQEIWLPGFDVPVKWRHFEALNESQEELGLRSGNRLTKNHIQYGKHKMKVLFAAQLFSGSSATSMDDYCMDQFDESIPDLKDSETTILGELQSEASLS